MVRLDPTEKEVLLFPFTVSAMLSGPSEKREEQRHAAFQSSDGETGKYSTWGGQNNSQLMVKFNASLVPLLTGLNTQHMNGPRS